MFPINKTTSKIALVLIMALTVSQTCNYENSVQLQNRSYEGILFRDGEYFVDEKTKETRGCICMKEICARKCCPIGKGYDENQFKCINLPQEFNPAVREGSTKKTAFNISEEFHLFFHKMNCAENELRSYMSDYAEDNFHLKTDGKLYATLSGNGWKTVYGPDKYCIDNFLGLDNKTVKINALFCLALAKPEINHYELSACCMMTSCFFIILTMVVYAFLPELRTTVHGKVMMAFLTSLFIGFFFMALMQILQLSNLIDHDMCLVMTFIIYFSILAAFSWLNVMCYDLWWKLKTINVTMPGFTIADRTRFLWYCGYAFSLPAILTILLAALEFSNLPPNMHLPNLRTHGCFIYGIGTSELIYLYTPMLFLIVANLVFFTLIAKRIALIKKQTQGLRGNERQRFALYVKLFIMTGINWILEVVSASYPEFNTYWQFTDACNVLLGFVIFVVFVCKRNIFWALKKRYRTLRGFPPMAPRLSSPQTTLTLQLTENVQMKYNNGNFKQLEEKY